MACRNTITTIVHDLNLWRRPFRGGDGLHRITVAAPIGHASKARTLAFGELVAFVAAVGFQSALPFAQKDFTVLDGPEHGTAVVFIARGTAQNAAAEISEIARRVTNIFTTDRSTIHQREATSGNVIVDHRWSTADARNTPAAHSSTTGLLIVEGNSSVVDHASFLGAAQARENRPVAFNAVLVASNVGATTSLIGNQKAATDATAWRKVLQFGFRHQTLTFWGTQVGRCSEELTIGVQRPFGVRKSSRVGGFCRHDRESRKIVWL